LGVPYFQTNPTWGNGCFLVKIHMGLIPESYSMGGRQSSTVLKPDSQMKVAYLIFGQTQKVDIMGLANVYLIP
jgi:hypothetical protein